MPIAKKAAKHVRFESDRCIDLVDDGRINLEELEAQALLILCEQVAKGNTTEGGLMHHRIASRLHDYLDTLWCECRNIPRAGGTVDEEGAICVAVDAAPEKSSVPNRTAVDALDCLTQDERDYLVRLDAGYGVEEISRLRGVSRKTIDRMKAKIEKKLKADPNAQTFLASLRADLRRTSSERETESTATQRRPHKAVFEEVGGVWVVRLDCGGYWIGGDGWSASWEKATHFASEDDARAEASRLADDGYSCSADFIPPQRVRVLTDERQRQQRKPVLDTLRAALDAVPWLFADAVYPQLLTKPGNGGIE